MDSSYENCLCTWSNRPFWIKDCDTTIEIFFNNWDIQGLNLFLTIFFLDGFHPREKEKDGSPQSVLVLGNGWPTQVALGNQPYGCPMRLAQAPSSSHVASSSCPGKPFTHSFSSLRLITLGPANQPTMGEWVYCESAWCNNRPIYMVLLFFSMQIWLHISRSRFKNTVSYLLGSF